MAGKTARTQDSSKGGAFARGWVMPYRSGVDKRVREPLVARQICDVARRDFGVDWSVMDLHDAQSAELIGGIGNDPETVDAVIHTPNGPLAIEMLMYAPEVQFERLARDEHFRSFLKSFVYDHLLSRRLKVLLKYRAADGVPSRDQPRVALEFFRILARVVDNTDRCRFAVTFAEFSQAESRARSTGTFCLPETEFPVCSSYFDEIGFFRHSGNYCDVDCMLHATRQRFDYQWSFDKIADKARISLGVGKQRARKLPQVLVFHTNGFGPAQRIHEHERADVVHAIRSALSQHENNFTEAWWLDNAAVKDEAVIACVWESENS